MQFYEFAKGNRMAKKKTEEIVETPEAAIEEAAADDAAKIEAAAETNEAAAEEAPKKRAAGKVKAAGDEAKAETRKRAKKEAPASDPGSAEIRKIVHKRAEKVGVVASDKMTKTVTVRVDRLVKHPIYRKYVRRRKKFMAHDELGAKVGDKVRIVETRPLSARKRWRVVEIIQKAEL